MKKIAEDLITDVCEVLKSFFFVGFFFPTLFFQRVVTVILNLTAFSVDHFREPKIRPVLQIYCMNANKALEGSLLL